MLGKNETVELMDGGEITGLGTRARAMGVQMRDVFLHVVAGYAGGFRNPRFPQPSAVPVKIGRVCRDRRLRQAAFHIDVGDELRFQACKGIGLTHADHCMPVHAGKGGSAQTPSIRHACTTPMKTRNPADVAGFAKPVRLIRLRR